MIGHCLRMDENEVPVKGFGEQFLRLNKHAMGEV